MPKITKKPTSNLNFDHVADLLQPLNSCTICPRNCKADRFKKPNGYCRSGADFSIASICIHKGEEPVLSGTRGICNVFFSHCNLQCIYCQNHQISCNNANLAVSGKYDGSMNSIYNNLFQAVNQIISILKIGINHVGFVSPTHFVPQMKVLIATVEQSGYKPVWVYNTNGYDKISTLQSLEGIIDIYLPDLKYRDPILSKMYSDAPDYPEVAALALKEMLRQKGAVLHLDKDGLAESGIIVRHLVLPGHVENSLSVMQFLADEISPRIHVSLMAQYFPTKNVKSHPYLGRKLTVQEYTSVTDHMEKLGLHHGWVQEFESSDFYQPDFNHSHPFENQ